MRTAKQVYERYSRGRYSDLDRLAKHITESWLDESYYPEELLGGARWTELFRATGPIVNGVRTSHIKLPRTIYRTAVPATVDCLTWTVSYRTAKLLVTETLWPSSDRCVWAATSRPEATLASFYGNPYRPDQVVVDPLMLDDIRPI